MVEQPPAERMVEQRKQRNRHRHSPTSAWHVATAYKSEKQLLPLRAESDRGVLTREHMRAEVGGGWCSRTPVAYNPRNMLWLTCILYSSRHDSATSS